MTKNILTHGLHKTCWLLLLTVLLFLVTLSAPYWVPHDPYLQNLDLALQAPNAEYPFGTDRYGRCVFSRVLVGGQSSIFSALALVGIIFTTGTAAGLWSGYYGGKLDNFIMRLSDIFLAFPGLVFAIAVASILGGGMTNAVLALAVISWPKYARLARSQALTVRQQPYIEAARLSGCSDTEIIFRHLLPSVLSPLLVMSALDLGTMLMELVACNTATAAALPALRETWPDMPIIGVIEPGSRAACEASPSGDIAVIATESTIRSGAYAEAILRRRPEAQVRSLACPLFVPLAEEGWFDGPIAEGVVSRYLEPLFEKSPTPDCLVLGCTHYPMLAAAIRKVVGPEVHIVDSAATTAEVVKRRLTDKGLAHPQAGRTGRIRFFITDDPQRFTRTGSLFLNMTITDSDVRLVDLENVPLPDAAETPTQRKSS